MTCTVTSDFRISTSCSELFKKQLIYSESRPRLLLNFAKISISALQSTSNRNCLVRTPGGWHHASRFGAGANSTKYWPKAATVRRLSAPACPLNILTADKCSRVLQKLTVAQPAKKPPHLGGSLPLSQHYVTDSQPQSKLIQSIPSYFFTVHFSIVLPSTSRSSWWSLCFRFYNIISLHIVHFSRTCNMLCPLHLPLLDNLNNICRTVSIVKLINALITRHAHRTHTAPSCGQLDNVILRINLVNSEISS